MRCPKWRYVGCLLTAKTSYDLIQQGGLKELAYLKKSPRGKRKKIIERLGIKKNGNHL